MTLEFVPIRFSYLKPQYKPKYVELKVTGILTTTTTISKLPTRDATDLIIALPLTHNCPDIHPTTAQISGQLLVRGKNPGEI